MNNFINACKKEGWNTIATKDDFLKLFEKNMYESMFAIGMSKEDILRIVYHIIIVKFDFCTEKYRKMKQGRNNKEVYVVHYVH